MDGRQVTGWFTQDFTPAELTTLRAVERLPLVRDRTTVFDGREQILTLQEMVELARRLSRTYGRAIAVFPETEHPTYFRSAHPSSWTRTRRGCGWGRTPGSGANDFGDAFAEYALYYGMGVDAVVTDFPDLAMVARRG